MQPLHERFGQLTLSGFLQKLKFIINDMVLGFLLRFCLAPATRAAEAQTADLLGTGNRNALLC